MFECVPKCRVYFGALGWVLERFRVFEYVHMMYFRAFGGDELVRHIVFSCILKRMSLISRV